MKRLVLLFTYLYICPNLELIMKSLILLSIGLFFTASSFAQTLRGKILDTDGNPIPAASVYIREIKQGLVCNSDGEFQLKIQPGLYTLECRSIGYEAVIESIEINTDRNIEIVLNEKDFQLPEVEVRVGEDPAYAIMRKAIEKAPYYQSIIKEASFEVYTKGSGKLKSMPKLLASMSGEDMDMIQDKLFLEESYIESHFIAPDQYEQVVKAYSSSIPNREEARDAIGLSMISLYKPMLGNMVSPLNPKAFSYYRFRYEGYEEDDGQIINIIRVIPKLNDSKFLEGKIYIADDDWNIRYAELTTGFSGMKINYVFNYHQVLDDIYLVTNYEALLNGNIMGVKFFVNFLSSIQYTNLQLNDSLMATQTNNVKQKKKKSLEIKWNENIKRDVDSLATKRDSVYWDEIRLTVLNEEEIKSYERKDTIQAYVDSVENASLHPKFHPLDLIAGGRLGGDSSKVSFRYEGILPLLSKYNFVDGFWLGQSLGFDFRRGKNTGFKIEPMLYWAQAREALIWNIDLAYDYSPMRLGRLQISSGSVSEDYNPYNGISRELNAAYSLGFRRNYARYYENNYLKLSNEIDLANGLRLEVGGEVAKRKQLENHTTFGLFGKKENIKLNIPAYGGDLNAHYKLLTQYNLRLSYTPEYYYRIYEGKKRYAHSRFPTFEIAFEHGLSPKLDNSEFYSLEFTVNQSVKLGLFDKLNYKLLTGKFFNDNEFNYIDYKHFSTSNQFLTGNSFADSYLLLNPYAFSTNEYWVQAFVSYESDYLLLKRLPFLQGQPVTEALHAKFFHTPEKEYYSEWGYSLDIIGLMGVGASVSFDRLKYNSVGFSISLPIFKRTKGKSIVVTIGN